MGPKSQIVAGGGWIKCQHVGKPKTRLFTVLSVVWLAVSLGASLPLWLTVRFPQSFSGFDWLCILLLLPQPVLIVLAVVFALKEKPSVLVYHEPIMDHDVRKLY